MSITFDLTTGISSDIDDEPMDGQENLDQFERAALSGVADLLSLIEHYGIGVTVTIGDDSRRFDVYLREGVADRIRHNTDATNIHPHH